jgi:hypothetical protein
MSIRCPDCGAFASYGREIGHRSDCPSLTREAVKRLSQAIREVEQHYPLPRCKHGYALVDGGGEHLEPPCGCRAV